MPAVLCGLTAGRAIVHELPKPILWEPGEGMELHTQALVTSIADDAPVLAFALFGTLVVT
jgi:hypothetical protein